VDEQHRQLVDHPFFALFRDAPAYEESQIVSGRGTVRGVRNRVKSGVAVFVDEKHNARQTVGVRTLFRRFANIQREVTSQSLWSRYDRHFVGTTRRNALR